jgi:hypothetical protein
MPKLRLRLVAVAALVGLAALFLTLRIVQAASPGPAAPPPQEATPVPETATMPITSSQQCLDCHTAPDQTMTLANGEQLYLTIDAQAFAAGVHGQEAVACTDCHTDIREYPHRPLTAANTRQVTAIFSQVCQECHEVQAELQHDSIHAQLTAEGNAEAAVCSDCHNAHYHPLVSERSTIVDTCARCHSGVAQDYRSSVHGQALQASENPDVPICIDCHGVHTIQDPRSAEFLIQSPQLCSKCHTDEEKMARYGLNTNVLNTYVADFHGTTVALFQRQTPDQVPNTPLCIDCHGVHNIQRTDAEHSTVLKENLLQTCQKCHPDATTNFSGAWLSHYTPSPQHNPLVYYVGQFYRFFIPTVLGGMALFVVSDVYRQIRQRVPRRGGRQ